jgi:hypothetical protein
MRLASPVIVAKPAEQRGLKSCVGETMVGCACPQVESLSSASFHLRVIGRLGYAKIAEQLNRDLSTPPTCRPPPALPGRSVTCARPKVPYNRAERSAFVAAFDGELAVVISFQLALVLLVGGGLLLGLGAFALGNDGRDPRRTSA